MRRSWRRWKVSNVKRLDEKATWIHTTVRVVIDLRKTTTVHVLKCPGMPTSPEPDLSISSILQLGQVQRFDLMAVVAEVIDERTTHAGRVVLDVRLVDGSKEGEKLQTLPLTIFLGNAGEAGGFKSCVGKGPLLFMCLQGSKEADGSVRVATVKDQTWWQRGAGPKHDAMAADAGALTGTRDTQDVQDLDATQRGAAAADYVNGPATQSACGCLDRLKAEDVLGDATEHLYQLNHVYVPPPHKEDSIESKYGLWTTKAMVWDHSTATGLAIRGKAMLQLAGLEGRPEQDYKHLLQSGELKYPLLASLRVRVQKRKDSGGEETQASQGESQLQSATLAGGAFNAIIVEAEPQSMEEYPNKAALALRTLLRCFPTRSDRLAPAALQHLATSPFYNLTLSGAPVDKALVLIETNQGTKGKNLKGGYCLRTDNVRDAARPESALTYALVSYCTFEAAPAFSFPTAARGSRKNAALAVVNRVTSPDKAGNAADLHVEDMQILQPDELEPARTMLKRMLDLEACNATDADASKAEVASPAFKQRKCRRLSAYPTCEDI